MTPHSAGSPPRHETQKHDNSLILSYTALQRFLGYLGAMLPLSLLLYAYGSGQGLQPSISDFYYTPMGDILVGILCAIGVFFLCYRGFDKLPHETLSDRQVSVVAGFAALGVALFPVRRANYPPDCPTADCLLFGSTLHPDAYHYASAAVFFICLALFCLVLFTRGDRTDQGRIIWTPRNRLYVACGAVIVVAMLAMIPYLLGSETTRATLAGHHHLFWCETAGILAFAVSWLRKGKVIEAAKDALQKIKR